LGTYVKGGSVTVEGGESFLLDKTSNHFNLGDALNGIYTDLDDENMDFLADGTYNDGDIDVDYTQTITPGSKTLGLFADSDYNDKMPTLGFKWANGDNVLDYDIEFDDTIPFTDLTDTDMPLLGNTYYVLSTTSSQIVLLDSAEKVVLSEGDTVTLGGKTVSIEFIDSTDVKFNVDGEITGKLGDHEYEELDDGSYIVANEVMYAEKEAGISKVEFSLGKGKMTLKDGEEIELNDEDVDGLVVDWTTNSTAGFLDAINIAWNSDGETFLTEEDAITMPLFETVKLVFGGLDFPDSPEAVSLDNGDEMTLTMGNYELPLFTFGATANTSTLGEEDYPLITATGSVTNYTAGSTNPGNDSVGGLDLQEGNRFLVTTVDTDLSDVETMYYEVKTIDWDTPDVLVELQDLIGSKDITLDADEDTFDVGDVTVTLKQVNDTHVYLWFNSTATLAYNKAVSEKGLVATLPADADGLAITLDSSGPGKVITFTEANKDDDVAKGMPFTATVKSTTNDKLHVSATNVTTLEDANDVYVGYVVSDLASKITHDQTADEYDFDIEYNGIEVTADVNVVAGGTISSGENTLGNVLVKDSEVSSVATKNLIVVGGSCINSAAAALVGGTKCGAAWTAATGIQSGQFLIKGYADSSITSEVALLVAGYEAEDTVKATTYLTNKAVDTSKAYKGTTTTETAVVIE
jgi:hypothetical protein